MVPDNSSQVEKKVLHSSVDHLHFQRSTMKIPSQSHSHPWNLFNKSCSQLSRILLAVFLMVVSLEVIESKFHVKTLPGFVGDLPFILETGYIGVGESDVVQFFYYFIESEGNPKDDPLILWLTGGPGCSALSGLFYEIGPLTINYENSTLEKAILELKPHSWTKVASIIFLDQPAGSGFSYARTPEGYIANDTLANADLPISEEGIEVEEWPQINIKGYVLGNPVTDRNSDLNSKIPYAHNMALLSDEIYESAKENCHGEYVNVDPINSLCIHDLQVVEKCFERIFRPHILEPSCEPSDPIKSNMLGRSMRSLDEISVDAWPLPQEGSYIYSSTWANSRDVREALHIHEEFNDIEWVRCNKTIKEGNGKEPMPYTHNVPSVVPYHQLLADKNCRALVYSGDHDMVVPYINTLNWIKSLNLSVENDWRPWFVDKQVAGYTMKFSKNDYSLTYATVKGGGHTAPEYKPKECLSMFIRWLANNPLETLKLVEKKIHVRSFAPIDRCIKFFNQWIAAIEMGRKVIDLFCGIQLLTGLRIGSGASPWVGLRVGSWRGGLVGARMDPDTSGTCVTSLTTTKGVLACGKAWALHSGELEFESWGGPFWRYGDFDPGLHALAALPLKHPVRPCVTALQVEQLPTCQADGIGGLPVRLGRVGSLSGSTMKLTSQSHLQPWILFDKPCSQLGLISLALFLMVVSLEVIESRYLVKTLPGFDGDLPFTLETGQQSALSYIGVGDSDDVQFFYYFIESEGDPKDDPLILWLTGGPGCSGLSALFYEIGPLTINYENSTLEKAILEIKPHSWTKVASIIFLDQPAGSGFSYARTPEGYISNDTLSAMQTYQFLRKGYVLGNPVTNLSSEYNSRIPFGHNMALLSDEIYESTKENCHGEYVNVDPVNSLCIRDLEVVEKCFERIFTPHILEPSCEPSNPIKSNMLGRSMRSLDEISVDAWPLPQFRMHWCRDGTYIYSSTWANSRDVREALHVHEVGSSFGDHDMVVAYFNTLSWIKSLNLPVENDWRAWFVNKQVAGYTMKFSKNDYSLTYATVKGGGHTAPEYKPKECLSMFMRWLANNHLGPLAKAVSLRVMHGYKCSQQPAGEHFPRYSVKFKIILYIYHSTGQLIEFQTYWLEAWKLNLGTRMKLPSQSHFQPWNNLFNNSCTPILFAVFLLLVSLMVIESRFLVKTLPGLDGDLPFTLETGYIGIGESDDVQFFYYFIESEGNPKDDPLVLWLTGGPGCSSLSGLLYEIGPLTINYENSTLEKAILEITPHSWTKVASIIFLDQPAGSGFSYARTPEGYIANDTLAAMQTYQFLRKWLVDHPEFLKNPFYVGGDSYSGIVVPMVVQEIYNGIEVGEWPQINIKGYVLGNPVTNISSEYNSRIPFAHNMALLSDEIYESAKENCRGEYRKVDPNNSLCIRDLKVVEKCFERTYKGHILEPACEPTNPFKSNMVGRSMRSLDKTSVDALQLPQFKMHWCREGSYIYSSTWANSRDVREALHIHEEFNDIEWTRCNITIQIAVYKGPISYTHNVPSVVGYHQRLANKNCRALVYSGDHDMLVPYFNTLNWIKSLNLPVENDWRPWFVDKQVAGYTMKFSKNDYSVTYATVKGGGHTAPEYKPKECLSMFMRWLANNPLCSENFNDVEAAFLLSKRTLEICQVDSCFMLDMGLNYAFLSLNSQRLLIRSVFLSESSIVFDAYMR
ncbi:hypothetical protein OSB04_030946 [Centaurea solstitialis]|uniref:Uncharacterized protein n=1 Tax=Centaurea solstitialis TaxID=347529 RepID=A0AA38S9E7_9ASTR|nr:hypothetical protein OSB04_030946 [Centaurea solstitialis]